VNFSEAKDKVLDFVDAVRADPKKLLIATAVIAFVMGFAVAKLA
jgi:hypothetical protein